MVVYLVFGKRKKQELYYAPEHIPREKTEQELVNEKVEKLSSLAKEPSFINDESENSYARLEKLIDAEYQKVHNIKLYDFEFKENKKNMSITKQTSLHFPDLKKIKLYEDGGIEVLTYMPNYSETKYFNETSIYCISLWVPKTQTILNYSENTYKPKEVKEE
jgi:hypothetical protein